jgi:hypothetical protein
VALCANASADLAAAFATGRGRGPWLKHTELSQNLLGDDPDRIIAALQAAVSEGASLADLGPSLCYAAALLRRRLLMVSTVELRSAARSLRAFATAINVTMRRRRTTPQPGWMLDL